MPHEPLSPEELAALRRFSTPSISNAIERFDVRPRHHGFTGPDIHCMFPEMPPIVGYASTAMVMAEQPAAAGRSAAVGGPGTNVMPFARCRSTPADTASSRFAPLAPITGVLVFGLARGSRRGPGGAGEGTTQP